MNIKSLLRIVYSVRVRRRTKSLALIYKVNHKSSVTNKTILGNNVNLNGI